MSPITNPLKSYAIIDSKGKIVETFRTKLAANQMKHIYEKAYYEELNIIKLTTIK